MQFSKWSGLLIILAKSAKKRVYFSILWWQNWPKHQSVDHCANTYWLFMKEKKSERFHCTMVFGKILYKNLPIYKVKTWRKWSSVDPHWSLVTHSAKGRFKWKNWLFIMPFCHLLSILAAFLIANCDFWLERTWLTVLKRFMTENWPKQKKSTKVFTRDQTGDLLCGSQIW